MGSPAGQFVCAASHSEPDVAFDSASESEQDDDELPEHDNRLPEPSDRNHVLLLSQMFGAPWYASVSDAQTSEMIALIVTTESTLICH